MDRFVNPTQAHHVRLDALINLAERGSTKFGTSVVTARDPAQYVLLAVHVSRFWIEGYLSSYFHFSRIATRNRSPCFRSCLKSFLRGVTLPLSERPQISKRRQRGTSDWMSLNNGSSTPRQISRSRPHCRSTTMVLAAKQGLRYNTGHVYGGKHCSISCGSSVFVVC